MGDIHHVTHVFIRTKDNNMEEVCAQWSGSAAGLYICDARVGSHTCVMKQVLSDDCKEIVGSPLPYPSLAEWFHTFSCHPPKNVVETLSESSLTPDSISEIIWLDFIDNNSCILSYEGYICTRNGVMEIDSQRFAFGKYDSDYGGKVATFTEGILNQYDTDYSGSSWPVMTAEQMMQERTMKYIKRYGEVCNSIELTYDKESTYSGEIETDAHLTEQRHNQEYAYFITQDNKLSPVYSWACNARQNYFSYRWLYNFSDVQLNDFVTIFSSSPSDTACEILCFTDLIPEEISKIIWIGFNVLDPGAYDYEGYIYSREGAVEIDQSIFERLYAKPLYEDVTDMEQTADAVAEYCAQHQLEWNLPILTTEQMLQKRNDKIKKMEEMSKSIGKRDYPGNKDNVEDDDIIPF